MSSRVGFGSLNSTINFYIANRPPIDDYPQMQSFRGLTSGEISHIVKNTSNHWRKVFNVYAKLMFDWYKVDEKEFAHQDNGPEKIALQKSEMMQPSWQALRDKVLFQKDSSAALLFSAPATEENIETRGIHIIAGKTYAGTLDLPPLQWLDTHFAINTQQRIIVSPYPDYRQLSNERIAQLIRLMRAMINEP